MRDASDFAIRDGRAQVASNKTRPGGSRMHINPKEGHPDMDYAEHVSTYRLFCKLTLWTVITVAVILALMGYFLT